MKKKHCNGCPLVDMFKKMENDKRELKELRMRRKKKDANFESGKFVQYTLLFEN